MDSADKPKGELVIRTIAMPADTNPSGDIFGGWIISQMDLGSGILAAKTAKSRVVTVAIEGMSFLHPVKVGDVVTVGLDNSVRILKVVGFAERRGDATAARGLYDDLQGRRE